MEFSDILNLLLAVGVWCTAYLAVAVLASFRFLNSLCPNLN